MTISIVHLSKSLLSENLFEFTEKTFYKKLHFVYEGLQFSVCYWTNYWAEYSKKIADALLLTHISLMLLSNRNQSTDVHAQQINWLIPF